jgi:hypothetical protein
MKLAKARLKSLEELEDKLNCCDGWKEWYDELKDEVFTVDVEAVELSVTYRCMFCGNLNKAKRMRLVPQVVVGGLTRSGIDPDMFDLDEGDYADNGIQNQAT